MNLNAPEPSKIEPWLISREIQDILSSALLDKSSIPFPLSPAWRFDPLDGLTLERLIMPLVDKNL